MKRTTIILLTLCALLCGCAQQRDEASPVTEQTDANTFAPELLPTAENANEWTLADFPGCFDSEWETAREALALDEGLSVTVLCGEADGPAVYVVAGVHGDETAGWRAGNLLKDAHLRAGTLCIISPANAYGAEHDQRKTAEERDLNRNFPGDADGCDAERIAEVIFADIVRRQPELLLDLHEAHEASGGGTDALGNSLVCDAVGDTGELIWELLLASERGTMCASALTLYGSPPRGSINRTVTKLLEIPAITVETLRTEPLAQRVRNHLEIVQYVLQYENML